MFRGLLKLEELWLHKNFKMYYIDEDAFQDLKNLRILHLDSSDLEGLYPSYFQAAWDAGNLKEVDTRANPFRCSKMCLMANWIDENPDFVQMANLGKIIK